MPYFFLSLEPGSEGDAPDIDLSDPDKVLQLFETVDISEETLNFSKKLISWPTLMNINFCQTNNMHSGSGIAVKLS